MKSLKEGLLLTSLVLAGCNPISRPATPTAVPTRSPGIESPAPSEVVPSPRDISPMIICAVPPELAGALDTAIFILFFQRDPKNPADIKPVMDPAGPRSGSSYFEHNSDDSLDAVDIPRADGSTAHMVRTGIKANLLLGPDGKQIPVDIGGCLVDQADLKRLQEFLTPGIGPGGQIGLGDDNQTTISHHPNRNEFGGRITAPSRDPLKGVIYARNAMRASKPQGPTSRGKF